MPAWTDISNALVSVGAKPFATTIQALRDNPVAIAEGEAGAPRILDAALSTGPATAAGSTWVALRTAGLTAGGIGTYAMLSDNDAAVGGPFNRTTGTLLAGGVLSFSNANQTSSALGPTGTWQLMGRTQFGSAVATPSANRVSIWLRVA